MPRIPWAIYRPEHLPPSKPVLGSASAAKTNAAQSDRMDEVVRRSLVDERDLDEQASRTGASLPGSAQFVVQSYAWRAGYPRKLGGKRSVRSFGCDGVLFDLDGVLVDSTRVVVRIWSDWGERRGIEAERILEVAHGRRTTETLRLVAPHLDAEAETEELERMELEDLDGVLEVKGAKELLSSLSEDGWTVVTSGPRALATRRIEHVGLPLPKRFVAAGDVKDGKPHPEAYLKGAEVLGVHPEACVVIEDAPSGIRAGKAAGMTVIAVATTHRGEDLSEADAVADSLADIRVIPGAGGGPRFELRVPS